MLGSQVVIRAMQRALDVAQDRVDPGERWMPGACWSASVQAGDAEVLAFGGAVADFALTADAQGVLERVVRFALRTIQAAMAHRDTSVSELCRELGITPVTLYRHLITYQAQLPVARPRWHGVRRLRGDLAAGLTVVMPASATFRPRPAIVSAPGLSLVRNQVPSCRPARKPSGPWQTCDRGLECHLALSRNRPEAAHPPPRSRLDRIEIRMVTRPPLRRSAFGPVFNFVTWLQ